MKHFLLTLTGFSILLTSVMADVAPPPPKGVRMHMRIVKSAIGAGGPVLQIPAKLYPTQTAALFDMRSPVTSGPMSLVVAGVLLAAGVFFAGRFFWNRRKKDSVDRSRRPILGLAIGSLMVLGAGTLIQNATADERGELNNAVAEGQMLEGTVTVQVRDDISEVALYLVPPRRPTWHPQSK
jgi:hypothetical protein